jgi:hypothetical protein
MRLVAEPISYLRLKRFHRWAMLWLKWFVRFLDEAGAFAPISKQAQTIGHRWLDSIERIIVSIVLLWAARHVRRCHKRKGVSERRLKEIALRRAIVGSRLRRALRPKDLPQRIEALTQNFGCCSVCRAALRAAGRSRRGLKRTRGTFATSAAFARR